MPRPILELFCYALVVVQALDCFLSLSNIDFSQNCWFSMCIHRVLCFHSWVLLVFDMKSLYMSHAHHLAIMFLWQVHQVNCDNWWRGLKTQAWHGLPIWQPRTIQDCKCLAKPSVLATRWALVVVGGSNESGCKLDDLWCLFDLFHFVLD